MDASMIETIALFRYEYVYPIISETYLEASKKDYYDNIAKQWIRFPDGEMRQIKPGTLKEWVHLYRKHGLPGLKPKGRADKGASRSLTTEQQTEILRLKQENPRRTATSIHKQLIQSGFYPEGIPSISTVQRYLAKKRKNIDYSVIEDMKAFEMAHINDLWQMDTTESVYLTIDGRKKKVYIIAIIDDASRFLVGYGLYFADTALNVQLTLKRAIQTYGKPRKIYTDNGKSYVSKQLQLICASLGIGIKRAQIYHGNQKGKIERWFGVMKNQWMHNLNYDDFSSLEELEASFSTYVIDRNNQPNRMLPNKQTPMERLSQEPDAIHKVPEKVLDSAFLHREVRKVANDGTISLFTHQYETGHATIGETVTLRFQPDFSAVYLEWEETLVLIQEVNKIDNSRMARKQMRMTGGE